MILSRPECWAINEKIKKRKHGCVIRLDRITNEYVRESLRVTGKTRQNRSRRFGPGALFGEKEGSGCASAYPIFKVVPMRHYYQINT